MLYFEALNNNNMSIQQFLSETFEQGKDFQLRPFVYCKDGFGMSVQASYAHYCTPRVTMEDGYLTLEIGYPTHEEMDIAEYAENKDSLTDTVYGYVPIDLINRVILKHGGIDIPKTLEGRESKS